jgi:hypothetical protein
MIWKRIQGYLGGLFLCVGASVIVATLVGRVWAEARFPVLIALVVFWLTGFLYILVRDIAAGPEINRAVFKHPDEWEAKELPQEFRFISHETALRDVKDTLGAPTRVLNDGSLRYDLPSGGAILLFPLVPNSDDSNIRGIQFYRTESDAPLFG